MWSCMMCDSNGTVRHVEIATRSSALVEMFKRHIRLLNVSLVWNWCLVRSWRSFCVRVILSQVNTLWLWLYTMWSCMIVWLEWYGWSCWEWNEEQCVGEVAQETYSYNWTYYWYEIDFSFEHDDHFVFDHFWAKSTLCGCDCIPCGHIRLSDRSIMVSI